MIDKNNHLTLTPLIQRFIYTVLYYCLTPVFFVRLLIKHQKSNAYKEQRQPLRLAERLGFFSRPDFYEQAQSPVWFHTVSVGEFIAALPLIRQVIQNYPQYPLVITCTTTTGSAQIVNTFATEIKQGKIFHVYLPYDLPGSIRRFLKKIRPRVGIIMETEIWPNLLYTAQKMTIPMWLLNARMSARSAKGYSRVKGLTQTALQQFTGIAAQDTLDAERLNKLGANDNSLSVTGSIKFDIQINSEDLEAGKALRQQLCWQDKIVLIAASTHKGEDEIVSSVYQKLKQKHPQLVMIVVPRHPERFETVYQLLNVGNNTVIKRSAMRDKVKNEEKQINILLGDSMGEMMRYFACADLVFMGGTLVPTGGHNILEPAAMGLPIVYGPHMFNFNAINELFLHYQAAQQVVDKDSLEQILDLLLSDKSSADIMANKAKQLIVQNTGAMDKMLLLLKPCLQ
ncbi:MAG: lipid IV(A) 3-deoxy-D-manno-octulosonic acid transferase [gamma proteobacterium symbiont of Bathyaustriella thionipta]|nr:lipid IV(A) 3-deoxy-D-manno-octulosonic acid transferase [gamma proteobacterium symbiont of Bathyaustriella thionipta]MCU7949285.1 lipid IV(A) 3-deoxy-D-manno-octulosonic acid transferase [gamma proteobacterium symbiont of Bathyaustriella thionipta]MCU7954001.1 lipid IV(A) 3-deoxy-D-manno-octulosonic acid transferase [gamma proteobacterium symbiont of Bathyaustriella thionipta]MCU7955888.1 lipid IV(A) 3-deoxy-D-manno-octulosonic acid transferase [gamma proteobacterium symbiont of Bathyaustrie